MDAEPKTVICPFCAVEVREGAVFCFNCGRSVVESGSAGSDEGSGEDAVEVPPSGERNPDPPADMKTPEAVAFRAKGQGRVVRASPVAKAAPQMRRRVRPAQKRDAGVSWEVQDDGPGPAFVLGAAGIAVISVFLLLTALYLR